MSAHNRSAPKSSSNTRKKSPAQAMVEFGLALPILLLVVYGLIEAGRLLFMYASVVSAARQAARYGSATGDNGSGVEYFRDCPGIRDAAKRLGFLQPIQDSDINISYDTGPGGANVGGNDCTIAAGHPINGDRILVQVSLPYAPILPFANFESFSITSTARRTLLVGVSVHVDPPPISLPGGTYGALILDKQADRTSFDYVGQIITYTYILTNMGADPIADIVLIDDKVGTISCPSSVLAPGSFMACTATYAVTQADADLGHLMNIATATGNATTGPVTASDSVSMNFVPRPQLTLTKFAPSPALAAKDQPVNYTFTLQNSGNVALTSPYTISDAKLNSWTCAGAVSPLAAGASTTCTGIHYLTNNDLNAGSIDNSATATAKYGAYTVTSNVATYHVLVPELMLVLSVSPPSVDALGYTLTYTYELWNRKPTNISNIKISDTRGLSGFVCPASGSLGKAGSGTDYAKCTRTYTGYTQADMDSGGISNTAHATASGGVNSNDPVATVTVLQKKEFTLTKTASVAQATNLNDPIVYSYSFTNTGNVTLSAPYTVADNKIASVDCSGATGTMAPGATKACSNVTYLVKQADLDAGSIINTATVSGMFSTSKITSAPVSKTVITYPGARLGVKKSASPIYYTSAGQTITYTFTLLNTGGVALNPPFAVTDIKVPGVTCLSTSDIPVGGTTTCTGAYLVQAGDVSTGFIYNEATATANGGALSSTKPSPATLTTYKLICTASTLYHAPPTPITSGSTAQWTIVNNTGIPLHITSLTVSWSTAAAALTQVLLGGTTIWYGPAPQYGGGFIVPGGPWTIGTGNTVIELRFSLASSGIRIVATFAETGCPILDSNVP